MEHPVLSVLRARRSVRAFRQEQVAEEDLQAVVEAGRHAPSGGNHQTTHLLVLQRPRLLEELTQLAAQAFAGMEIREDTYRSLRGTIERAREGTLRFTYGAPTLVVVANQRGYVNAMADSAAAMENMLLAASALGVGSCWINQLHWLDEAGHPGMRACLEGVGLLPGEIVCGAVALGYPKKDPGGPLPRTGNPVTWVK